MKIFFRVLTYACLLMFLVTDGAISQNIADYKKIVPTYLLLLKKKNFVFLTSTTHTGNLGGLTGADEICQHLATSAGLPGKYLAWLSDATESPATRFIQSTVPYVLVDGTQVAADWNDLIDAIIDAPINKDEKQQSYSGWEPVWSHTRFNGTPYDDTHNCDNWTAAIPVPPALDLTKAGSSNATGGAWTEDGIYSCNRNFQFYCFQQ